MVYNKAVKEISSHFYKTLCRERAIELEKRFVYADNAATTKVSQKALNAMLPYFTENYGNASSIYSLGGTSARAIITAREQVANAIGAKPNEIYFTSGGSESDNWAIRGCAENGAKKSKSYNFV